MLTLDRINNIRKNITVAKRGSEHTTRLWEQLLTSPLYTKRARYQHLQSFLYVCLRRIKYYDTSILIFFYPLHYYHSRWARGKQRKTKCMYFLSFFLRLLATSALASGNAVRTWIYTVDIEYNIAKKEMFTIHKWWFFDMDIFRSCDFCWF